MHNTRFLPVPLAPTPDGALRVGESQVLLETIVNAFERGAIADEIAAKHKDLSLSDVFLVLSYYLLHRHEVEVYLEGRQRAKRRPKPAA